MSNSGNNPHPTSAATDPQQTMALLARAQQALRAHDDTLVPLAHRFETAGYELYLVGGSVRDALLGRLGHDLDFTTNARPEAISDILTGWADVVWDTGIEFGTVSAEKNHAQIEITTFRADQYDGQSRNPEVTFGDSLDADLIRRDFKVNAMAVQLFGNGDQKFLDPMGGLQDLEARLLDTPGTPEDSFNDDPLRMLRAARFASALNFAPAPRVVAAMTDMASQIDRITAERIQTELNKLMLGENPTAGLELMVDTGLAERFFPEIPGMQMTQDEHMQHKDVYAHSLQVMRQAIDLETDGPDLVLRWAALLHDIGKPATRAAKPGGGVTFYHHEVVGAKMVRKRLRALKYPKQVISDIGQLVFLHQRFHGYGESQWTDSAVRRYVTDAGPLLERLHKLVRADCTTRNKRKAARLQRIYDDLENRIEELAAQEDLAKIRPDLDGNEIMQLLDLKPGPEVGAAWGFLKELRLERGPMEREDAILELKKWWVSREEGNS